MSAETPNRTKTRAELAFEKYEQTQKAKIQEQQIKLQRVEQSYWYRFLHKMDQKLVIRNRMTRELRKMIFYITLPVVATFILTNPQISEKIILNYTPFIEIRRDTPDIPVFVNNKQSIFYEEPDLYFKTKEAAKERVKNYLESIKQQSSESEEERKMNKQRMEEMLQQYKAKQNEEKSIWERITDYISHNVESQFDRYSTVQTMYESDAVTDEYFQETEKSRLKHILNRIEQNRQSKPM